MINFNDLHASEVRHGKRNVIAIAYGKRTIWSSGNACFSSGTWNGSKKWLSNEVWKS